MTLTALRHDIALPLLNHTNHKSTCKYLRDPPRRPRAKQRAHFFQLSFTKESYGNSKDRTTQKDTDQKQKES